MRFAVTVEVTGLEGISDPEGQTIERVLPALGFEGVEHVRVGKLISFDLAADDAEQANRTAEELCRRLLANPVMERAKVNLVAAGDD